MKRLVVSAGLLASLQAQADPLNNGALNALGIPIVTGAVLLVLLAFYAIWAYVQRRDDGPDRPM